MTRTARSTYPRAIQKDRESRSGLESSMRKGGAGQHNWGSITDEHTLESAALEDETVDLAEASSEHGAVGSDVSFKANSDLSSSTMSEDSLEEARKFRKNVLHKKDVDLSAIARTSVAASTSPPSKSSVFVRRGDQDNKQIPLAAAV